MKKQNSNKGKYVPRTCRKCGAMPAMKRWYSKTVLCNKCAMKAWLKYILISVFLLLITMVITCN